jgi:hypothetical protein
MESLDALAVHLIKQTNEKRGASTDGDLVRGLQPLRTLARWSSADGDERLLQDFRRALSLCDESDRRRVRVTLGLGNETVADLKPTPELLDDLKLAGNKLLADIALTKRRRLQQPSMRGAESKLRDILSLAELLWQMIACTDSPSTPQTGDEGPTEGLVFSENGPSLEGFAPTEVSVTWLRVDSAASAANGANLIVILKGRVVRRTRLFAVPIPLSGPDIPGKWSVLLDRAEGDELAHVIGTVPTLEDRPHLATDIVVVAARALLEIGDEVTVNLLFSPDNPLDCELATGLLCWTVVGTEETVSMGLVDSDGSEPLPIIRAVEIPVDIEVASKELEVIRKSPRELAHISLAAVARQPQRHSNISFFWKREKRLPELTN